METAALLDFSTSGDYREERLYLLQGTKRQENKLDEALKNLALITARTAKVEGDLNEAHGRIRGLIKSKDDLSRRILKMEIRAGSIATLAGMLTAGAIEALRHYLPLLK